MSQRLSRHLTALCGILGTITLLIYFSAPYWLMPLPPPKTNIEQLVNFGRQYHNIILFDTWLQQVGSLLSVIFVLALVHLAGASDKFMGKLTLLVSGLILALSLAEGTFVLATIQAIENKQPEAMLTCFGLTNVFIHIFLIAPSLILVLGGALSGTRLLPKIFVFMAFLLGALFQILGFLGLFYQTAVVWFIYILIAQNLWTHAASIALIRRATKQPAKIESKND
ncbi:MAG TPA: hypothetical protein VGZ71_03905 [Puia sp.]|nr:hypothetical protein [Puia sp.]